MQIHVIELILLNIIRIINVDFMAERLLCIGLDVTCEPNKVATACEVCLYITPCMSWTVKLFNCTRNADYIHFFVVMIGFHFNSLPQVPVPVRTPARIPTTAPRPTPRSRWRMWWTWSRATATSSPSSLSTPTPSCSCTPTVTPAEACPISLNW